MAASRFARVFELAAPDAPGLINFGAQFDPALADPMHEGSPLVGVSGVGLTLQQAFQSCVGEGVEYLSQLQREIDLLHEPGIHDPAERLGPMARELVADAIGASYATGGSAFLASCNQANRPVRGMASGGYLPAPSAGAARNHAALPIEYRIGRRAVTGDCCTARSAGTDRARCCQPLVARWSAGAVYSGAA